MKKIVACLIIAALSWTMLTSPSAIAATPDFSDVTKHWAKNQINQIAGKGYIKGYSDNTFRPDKPITRGDFVYALIRCLGYKATDTKTASFSDTKNHWATAQINAAVKNKIIITSEYKGGFKPNGSLKRSEAAAMMVRALGKSPESGPITFQDKADVEKSLYRGYIVAAYSLGLVSSHPDGQFKPFNMVSRAQACVMLSGLLTKIDPSTTAGNTSGTGSSSSTTQKATKIKSVVLDGYKYSPEYVNLYIGTTNTNKYLSEMEIVNENTVRINGKIYDLSTSRISIELSGKFYTIQGVTYSGGNPVLNLNSSSPVVYKKLSMDDISAIFVDSNKLSLRSISVLTFIIDSKDYDLSEVAIDVSGNFSVNGKTYVPNQVMMLADGAIYKLDDVEIPDDEFIIYCSAQDSQSLVKVNDSYLTVDQIKIIKDSTSYPFQKITVVSKNLIRLAGRQYELDSTFKCQYDNKVYDIDYINYDTTLNTIVMETTEATGYYGSYQPIKFTFYLNDSLFQDGTTSATNIYAKNGWRSFYTITVSDPGHFTYDEAVNDFIGALVKIGDNQYTVTDTVWRGRSQIFEIYLVK